MIVISLSWNIARQKNEIIEVATNEANTIFEKDLVYYRWATSHKGVYVPITRQNPSQSIPGRSPRIKCHHGYRICP